LILEMLQFFLKRGSFDVDDIILNTMGFLLGAVLYRTVAGRSG
jgi:glycopeptide antibiotics resistance protein